MHSRKSQSYRTQQSDKFRAGTGMIMFSSDVSARGLDYPGVTQAGAPVTPSCPPGHPDGRPPLSLPCRVLPVQLRPCNVGPPPRPG